MPDVRPFFLLCAVSFLTFLYYIHPIAENEEVFIGKKRKSGEIVIYAATKYFGREINDSFLEGCPQKNFCRISNDPMDHFEAAAVLFHNRDFVLDSFERKKEQIYVWFTQETPIYEYVNVPPYYINWTMSYRSDSDIWNPYSKMEILPKEEHVDFDAIWNEKKKTVAWLASNCVTDNRRKELVYALKAKGFDIDLWGDCGNPLPYCPRKAKNWSDCVRKEISPYKFYLALENSNCPDYATEKFWTSLATYRAVPIVMERRIYSSYKIPPTAFIAVDDFSSLDEMISVIHRLASNRTEYLQYHEWRRSHRVLSDSKTGFCELCRLFKENQKKKQRIPSKAYKDLSKWFSPSECDQKMTDKYLGRSTLDVFKCTLNSFRFRNSHWNC